VLKPGEHIGDWVVGEPLGEGGMATVYRVHSLLAERLTAAVKVLKPTSDPEARARFVREAEALSRLSHPAIVRVMGFSEDPIRGLRYLVMELAEGKTLRERLDEEGALPITDALIAFLPLASALEHAHEAGIVHRDLKPGNIVLCNTGGVRLVDFGIVTSEEWETLTTGGHLGTLAYLPPEIYRSEPVESRSLDVYGFGLVLHEALTGTRVFAVEPGLSAAAAAAAVAVRKLQQPALDPGEGFPEPLRDVVRRATDPDPARRPSMLAVRETLESLFIGAGLERRGPEGHLTERLAEPVLAALTVDLTARVPEPRGPVIPLWKQKGAPTRAGGGRRRRWPALRSRRAAVLLGALAVTIAVLAFVAARARGPLLSRAAIGDTWASPRDGTEYVFVPAGTFEMGCTPGDDQCDRARWPARRVTFDEGFWMARTETTVGAYQRFATETGRPMPPAPDFNRGWSAIDHPIVNVTWHEAEAYCAWAGGALPKEEQWEYASRGGHPDWFHPWGNQKPVCAEGAPNGARFDDGRACREAGTARVGSYSRNGFGLADLAGNVWEWCADPWQPRYGDLPSRVGEPDEPGGRHVLRGGSWVNGPEHLRVSIRSGWLAGTGRDFIGFRCVRGVRGGSPSPSTR
jgi:formylglycine-generating enzyme required for sulfatase activity